MILKIINHKFEYDMKNLCTIFFPYEKIKLNGAEDEDIVILTEITQNEICVCAKVYDKHATVSRVLEKDEDAATALSVLLYNVLSDILDFEPPWGILYGVRPAKRMHKLCEKLGENGVVSRFENEFLVKPQKVDLTRRVMNNENKIIALSTPKSYSLYISIPFCPSRCSYCSFVSHSIENTRKLVEPYVCLLIKELEETAKIAKKLGLRLECIYFGGGTPTTLEPDQFERVFNAIDKFFDLSTLREYTVEAGRPDTITKDKLIVLKNAGVNRISINPQSFNEDVLKAIGRHHTADEIKIAYELAQSMGFENINMDFIAGLPNDSVSFFEHSVKQAVNMNAASITIHTLSMKSGAYLVTRETAFDLKDRLTVADMVDVSRAILEENNYNPYYMYRQSKSLGNLENVGWSKNGSECLYNVFMMDETHTVLSAGAGAVTRLKAPLSGQIERIYNYKYPYEYINDFEDILIRKNRIIEFFDEYI